MDLCQGLKFKGSFTCHFACGAPVWVCDDFKNVGCAYRDILLPLLLIAFRTDPYAGIMRNLAQRAMTEREFLIWLADCQDGNGRSLKLYSRKNLCANKGVLCAERHGATAQLSRT